MLRKLLTEFLNGKLDSDVFCADIVTAYNDAVDRSALTRLEQQAFEELFDEVALYSSDPPETWEYPGYRTAEQIRAAAIKTVDRLGLSRE